MIEVGGGGGVVKAITDFETVGNQQHVLSMHLIHDLSVSFHGDNLS